MTTHELARALGSLAAALRKAPDQTLDELSLNLGFGLRHVPDAKDIPVALSTLVALSDIDKNQWLNFIKEYDFPIETRPRDASRDILGKLLNYLERNPEARRRLAVSSQKDRSQTSPELLRALKTLLDS